MSAGSGWLAPGSLDGERVVVTGASRGIGLAVARVLARAGASVIGAGRDTAALQAAERELSPRFESCVVDLTDREAADRLGERLADEPVTGLVNNAGINRIDDIRHIKDVDWDLVLEVNLTAPARLARVVAAGMARRGGGRIVNVASIFGQVSRAKRGSYSAAKAGIIGLTRAMALDLAQSKVLVNAVCPGFTDTELTRSILKPEEFAELAAAVPLRRMATPDEIALLIAFFASSANTYVTGQAITIDGGYTAQ